MLLLLLPLLVTQGALAIELSFSTVAPLAVLLVGRAKFGSPTKLSAFARARRLLFRRSFVTTRGCWRSELARQPDSIRPEIVWLEMQSSLPSSSRCLCCLFWRLFKTRAAQIDLDCKLQPAARERKQSRRAARAPTLREARSLALALGRREPQVSMIMQRGAPSPP